MSCCLKYLKSKLLLSVSKLCVMFLWDYKDLDIISSIKSFSQKVTDNYYYARIHMSIHTDTSSLKSLCSSPPTTSIAILSWLGIGKCHRTKFQQFHTRKKKTTADFRALKKPKKNPLHFSEPESRHHPTVKLCRGR